MDPQAGLQEAIRTDPERFLRVLDEQFRGRGRSDEAIALHQQVVEAHPDLAKGHYALARLYGERGAFEKALQSYDRALELAPDMAAAHYDRANLLFVHHREEEAIAGYRRAVELDPKLRDAHFQLGNALSKRGALLEGAAAYQAAVDCDPDFGDGFFNLGNNLRRIGRLDEAQAAFESALAIDPSSSLAELCLGTIAKRKGDLEVALRHYGRAHALDPNLAAPLAEAGGIHLDLGNNEKAIAGARQALSLDADYFKAYITLSEALAGAGRVAEAKQASLEAVRLRRSYVQPFRGREPVGRVVVLKSVEDAHFRRAPNGVVSVGGGANNAPDHFDQSKFLLHSFYVDGFDAAAELDQLPGCDAIFNSLSDVDAVPKAHEIAGAIAPRVSVPIINPPDLIGRTQRHTVYQTLCNLEGISFPATIRLEERPKSKRQMTRVLEQAEISFPVLARLSGTHTGRSLEKIDDLGELEAYFSKYPAGPYYITQFVDFFDRRGAYVKMRLTYIDGVAYPSHFFVSENWNVHVWQGMYAFIEANDWLIASAKQFYADPEAFLGRDTYQALGSVHSALPLDYFAIDFAQLGDGSTLIFESNASIRLPYLAAGELDAAPYRKPAAQAVYDSISRLLEKKIREFRSLSER